MNKEHSFRKISFMTTVLVVILIAVIVGTTLSVSSPTLAYAAAVTSNEIETSTAVNNKEVEVFSYLDILEDSYSYLQEFAENHGKAVMTFEEYCDGYYSSGVELDTYTRDIAYSVVDDSDLTAGVEGSGIMTLSSVSSGAAFYILDGISHHASNFNPEITPQWAFKEELPNTAQQYYFDYSKIMEGDIIIETKNAAMGAGHAAFVYDIHKKIEGTDQTYIQTIEAVKPTVSFGYLDERRLLEKGVVILRASYLNVDKAKAFCLQQVEKPYELPKDYRVNTSINSSSWYCSEMIYAAYNYAGNWLGFNFNIDGVCQSYCFPFDLYYNPNLKFVQVSHCLEVKMIKKSGKIWNLRVYNPGDQTADCHYNSLMCFEGDAKNWVKLKNEYNISIGAHSYKDIEVKENWFAGTIALCNLYNGRRYITYLYNLNGTTKRFAATKSIV